MGQAQPPPPQPGYQPPYPGAAGPPRTNGLAVAGMVLGIASVALFFLNVIASIIGVVGLILSLVGLSKAKQMGGSGRGMAIAGVITSAIGIVLGIVLFIVALQAAQDISELEEILENARGRLG